jgi:polyhydroxyalkanoate synthesis repressor PhaR
MVTIKRYPNRKLYNTEAKQYITLDGIADLVRNGEEIHVVDHASGEDLTALTLTQIILEQEKKQGGLMTNSFLTGLIRTGGDRLSALQRSLPSPLQFWRQIDEEIKQRIQGLVQQGELSREEGKSLIEKLARQGMKRINDSRSVTEDELEQMIRQRAIPSQDDIQRLNAQIEELTRKIESMASEDTDQTQ